MCDKGSMGNSFNLNMPSIKQCIEMLLFYYWPLIMLFDIIGLGLILPDQIDKYNETIYVLFVKLGHFWNDIKKTIRRL